MGKGDKRSKRGKIFAASFGNTRRRAKKKTKTPAKKKQILVLLNCKAICEVSAESATESQTGPHYRYFHCSQTSFAA